VGIVDRSYISPGLPAGRSGSRRRTRLLRRRPPWRRRVALAVALLLAGCGAQPQTALQQIRARGELRVVTVNAPTTYYLGAHGALGFEYRLAASFAAKLGVRLAIQPVADVTAMRVALRDGRADLAAAQISADPLWQRFGLATESYGESTQVVVQARGRPQPRDITALRGARIVVHEDSPQQLLLRAIRRNGVPDLTWTAIPHDQEELLEFVSRGDADYAIVDQQEFEFAQHLYPDVTVAFALPDPRPLQWVGRADGPDLVARANEFFNDARTTGEVARIALEESAESRQFDYLDAHRFQADISSRLPELQGLFEEASQVTGLDWRLLAAVGYQESKWQREAVSGDGAQGIMMLTTDAASMVGVSDRGNLRENILGGAKYLAQVIDTIPKRIAEPDRTWLALAAYNVGYGHLEDARVLAQRRGKNPDVWEDVREQLPLLTQEQWYSSLKRGYARGWEPARFVEQVREYLAVLEWLDAGTVARNRELPTHAAMLTPEGDAAHRLD
jgi:membrane-bound lytic murein transglycosylase F